MYKPKLSVGVQLGDAEKPELIKGLKDAGIDTLEVAACEVCSATRAEQDEYFEKTERRLDAFRDLGFNLNSFHMTFGPLFCYFNFNDEQRAEAVRRSIDICKRVSDYGFKYIVTHTNGWDFPVGGDREKGLSNLIDSYRKLVKESPVRIAAEVLPRNCLGNTSKEMLYILGKVDGLKTVIDLNHIMQEKESDCVLALRDYLVGLHVSDRDEINERHWLPGEGIVDFMSVIAALEKIGYDGYFTYEVCNMKTYDDPIAVRNNYEDLFRKYAEYSGK